jgi:hypothetical protein
MILLSQPSKREIYYKELANTIMETKKSPDLQFVGSSGSPKIGQAGDPRRAIV